MTTQRIVQVPAEACRFAADLSVGEATGDLQNIPFRSLARTADPVGHWYWGERTVHDFAGMVVNPWFTVDYCHDQYEAMGFCNKQEVTAEGLVLSGELTPFKADDRVNEVVSKSKRGVKYQSSIDFDEFELVVEDVPPGMSAEVNGKTLAGPLTIFRQWKLDGLGICIHGVDGSTNLAFSKSPSGKKVAVTRFTKGTAMADETPTDAPVTDPNETPTVEKTQEELDADAAAAAAAAVAAVADVITTAAVAAAPAADAPAEFSRKQEADKFTGEFGETYGRALFAAGWSLDQARSQFSTIMRKENERLQAQVNKLSKPSPGGAKPASFGASGQKQMPAKFAHLGSNLGRFASGIKLPGAAK